MVSEAFMMTVAGDGQPKGSRVPKAARSRKGKAKTGSATPATSDRDTPAFANPQPYGRSKDLGQDREASGTPLFDWSSEGAPRPPEMAAVPKTPIPVRRLTNEPISLGEDDDVVDTIEDASTAPPAPAAAGTDVIVLDPSSSERQYCQDPFTGWKREVWRPGDGDGDESTDYVTRPNGSRDIPVKQRWRFYQSSSDVGPYDKDNMPPKHVFLDDRATWEVLSSNITKTAIMKYWPHDIGGGTKIRARRSHRGRPAIADPDAEGNARYHSGVTGQNKDPYFFTGQKDYKPIIYRSADPAPAVTPATVATSDEQSKKRKASSSVSGRSSAKRQHNQHTLPEDMVKNGAPSSAKGRGRYLPRINTFLRRDPSPPWSKDRSKLYGGVGDQARAFTASMALQSAMGADLASQSVGTEPMAMSMAPPEIEESLWVDQDEQDPEPFNAFQGAMASDLSREVIPDGETGGHDSENDAPGDIQRGISHSATAFEDTAIEDSMRNADMPRRKKLAQPMSFLEHMATSSATSPQTASPNHQIKSGIDSGSYANKLERELLEARGTIESLNAELGQAQAKILQLEAEVVELREDLAEAESP